MSQNLGNVIKCRSLPPHLRYTLSRTLILPVDSNFTFKDTVRNPNNINSAIEYYIQIGDSIDLNLCAVSDLFSEMNSECCFDTLRTKEQLGYMVHSGIRKEKGVYGYRIIVQSERDPKYLESRVESFLDRVKVYIINLD